MLTDTIRTMIDELEIEPHLGTTSADETAAMVAEMYAEVFGGIHEDPAALFERDRYPASERERGQLVMLSSVTFHSMCEHHFLPFFGTVDLAYVTGEHIIGLGNLTQLVKTLMRRPQLQERFTDQIAQHIVEGLSPLGVAVHVRGRHFCEAMRGTREHSQVFKTWHISGMLNSEAAYREAFMAGIGTTAL